MSLVGPDGCWPGSPEPCCRPRGRGDDEHLGFEKKGDRPDQASQPSQWILGQDGAYQGPAGPSSRSRETGRDVRAADRPKHARQVEGFDEAIISLYAKGLTTGEIAMAVPTVSDLPLPPSVASVTPADYRNPDSLPDGQVLVVGASWIRP